MYAQNKTADKLRIESWKIRAPTRDGALETGT
jgi:hypothetical protein